MTEPKGEHGGKVIKFQAQVIKVQTMTDGANRVTLDFSQTDIDTASRLMEVKARSGILEIAAIAIEPLFNKQDQDATKRRVKQSGWTPAKSESADSPTRKDG